MKTKVTVIIEVEVTHESKMPKSKIRKLASRSVICNEINGASADYGFYGAREKKREFSPSNQERHDDRYKHRRKANQQA